MGLLLQDVAARHPSAAAGALAIEAIDLTFDDGEQVALIGPSGAGKTTLLSVCALQLRPAGGRVIVDDIDPWTLSSRARHALRRTLAVAPQVPPLPARQRVVTSVLGGRLPGQTLAHSIASLVYPARADLAFDALETMQLGHKLWDRVDRLSSGERQRVSLARLLVSDASRWFVDEPLSALDPALAERSLQVLVGQAGARRVTMLASLHQVDLAIRCFPRVIGLAAGRVLFDRSAAAIDVALQARLYGLEPRDGTSGDLAANSATDAATDPAADAAGSTPGFVEDGFFAPARAH